MRSPILIATLISCGWLGLSACTSDTPDESATQAQTQEQGVTGYWRQVDGTAGTSISRLRFDQSGSSLSGNIKAVLSVRFERDVVGSVVGDSVYFSIPGSDGTPLLEARGLVTPSDSLYLSIETPGQFGGTFSSTLVRQDV